MLATHNRFRKQHCAPELVWSSELEAEAQRWADTLVAKQCAFEHDMTTPHGENLAFFSPVGSKSPGFVATAWYDEVSIYEFKAATFSMATGHFTQLVWASTRAMGCATATCGGGTMWVCRYDPPGNVRGAFTRNVKPASSSCK